MTLDTAKEIVKQALLNRNAKGEVVVKDMLQLSIACTILNRDLTQEEIDKILTPELQ